jgi:hypothetical protein
LSTFNKIFGGILLAVSLVSGAVADQTVGTANKAALQAAMQRHIDRSLVDGAYLHLDFDSGDVRKLHPVKAHPMILQMGEYFVLCSDFRDKTGKLVNVDFYLARHDRSYVVFHSAVDDRINLERLMKKRTITRLQ